MGVVGEGGDADAVVFKEVGDGGGSALGGIRGEEIGEVGTGEVGEAGGGGGEGGVSGVGGGEGGVGGGGKDLQIMPAARVRLVCISDQGTASEAAEREAADLMAEAADLAEVRRWS